MRLATYKRKRVRYYRWENAPSSVSPLPSLLLDLSHRGSRVRKHVILRVYISFEKRSCADH